MRHLVLLLSIQQTLPKYFARKNLKSQEMFDFSNVLCYNTNINSGGAPCLLVITNFGN